MARELEALNRQRQEIDRATLVRAVALVEALDLDATYGIVLAEDGWHPGVIGIVASRLVEEFARPTVLVALSGEEGRGSGRSIPAFDLHAGLSECADVLVRFGGHRAAAGVTIERARVGAFAERFNAIARAQLTAEDLIPELRVDLEVSLADVTSNLEELLRHFEPFGVGNPAPSFLARGVRLAAPPRTLARDGLKLRLAADGVTADLEAVAWGVAHRAQELDVGRPLDVVFRVERDEWQGEGRLQAKVADFRV